MEPLYVAIFKHIIILEAPLEYKETPLEYKETPLEYKETPLEYRKIKIEYKKILKIRLYGSLLKWL